MNIENGTERYDYRLIEKRLTHSIVYDEGPGSTVFADETSKSSIIWKWYGGDKNFGLALRVGWELRELMSYFSRGEGGMVRYVLERKLSGESNWEYYADPMQVPRKEELPAGYSDFNKWYEDYLMR